MPGGHDTKNSPNWISQARGRLALRRAEKPVTKAGQIQALWPDIEAALAVGQSIRTICTWLEEDAGITLGVTSLTSYISRIRRREAANREAPTGQFVRAHIESIPASSAGWPMVMTPVTKGPEPRVADNPLAQAMRVLSKPTLDIRKIHNDGDPQDKNLI